MVQPPSKQLQQVLLGKKLCTPRDLKRCVCRVRRLTADLPAFDSVWLDALVKTRKLTSFQAQTIESGLTELLTIGPGIVLEQIGSGPAAATYLVQIPEAQIPAVIKRIPVATELKQGTLARFSELAQRARSVGHWGVVVPHACHEFVGASELARVPAKTEKGVSPSRRRRRAPASNELVCELAAASRLVEGLSLSQMLLRRGRFPASVVLEIARQLLESLAVLGSAGIVHGEILADNVLIDSKGRAILIDAGVRPCVQPEFSFSATIDPRRYSGIAPELIGTGQRYSHRSDLYALGCLLWELLTARPVFASGDPLARLAEHQTARVPDVREIAPDTPAGLAEAILWLTEPDADQRPRTASAVLGRGGQLAGKRPSGAGSDGASGKNAGAQSGNRTSRISESGLDTDRSSSGRKPRVLPARSSRRSLANFSAGFRSRPIGRSKQRQVSARFAGHIAAAGLAVLVASAALVTLHGQSREWVTAAIAASTGSGSIEQGDGVSEDGSLSEALAGSRSAELAETGLKPFPKPDAYGLITLPDGGPWRTESVLWSGRQLTIRGLESEPAVLIIDQPVRLRASEIAVENVEVMFEQPSSSTVSVEVVSAGGSAESNAGAARSVAPSLNFESQALLINGCVIASGDRHEMRSRELADAQSKLADITTQMPDSQSQFAFVWGPFNPRDSLPGEIRIEETRLVGDRSSIGLAGSRHLVRCRNVLQSGAGSLFVIRQSRTPGRHDFELQHCTLRESGGLVEVRLDDGNAWKSQVRLQPVACVFDLSGSGTSDPGALVRFRANMPTPEANTLTPKWHETLVIDGSDSIARPDLRLVEGMSKDGRIHQELDASSVTLNGLTGAQFEFQAPDIGAGFVASILKSHDASLTANERPGVGGSRSAARSPRAFLSNEPPLKGDQRQGILKESSEVESEATR